MSVKVSVIIPVYNGGEYLRPCIDSVLNQTMTEIELILVDDASSDGSSDICNEYARKDSRVKALLFKSNHGGNAANIAGRNLATGEYVLFMDDDDELFPTALETLYDLSDSCDIVKGLCVIANEGKTYHTGIDGIEFGVRFNWRMLPLSKKAKYFCSSPEIWTMLINRNWLESTKIFPGDHRFNDTDFAFRLKEAATSFKYVPSLTYKWNIRQGSVSHTDSHPIDVVKAFKTIEQTVDTSKDNLLAMVGLERYRVYMWNYSRISDEAKKLFLPIMARDFRRDIHPKELYSEQALENIKNIISYAKDEVV